MSTQTATSLVEVEDVDAGAAIVTYPLLLPTNFGTVRMLPEGGRFTAAHFAALAAENRDLQLEMTKEGEMIIMTPAGPVSSNRNGKLTARLVTWGGSDNSGLVFDSSAGFTLPNGAQRSPDASWIRLDRWEALTQDEKETFSPICPDFVVELRSKTDRLKTARKKMEEYIENGAQLGWLIDPKKKKVHVYRPGAPVEILDNPVEVSGEPLLKGFKLKLTGIID